MRTLLAAAILAACCRRHPVTLRHSLVLHPGSTPQAYGTWLCSHPSCAWFKAEGFAGTTFDIENVRRSFDWAHVKVGIHAKKKG